MTMTTTKLLGENSISTMDVEMGSICFVHIGTGKRNGIGEQIIIVFLCH